MEYLRSSIAALPLVIIGAWLIAGLFGMRITRARGLTRWSTPSRLFHWVMAFAILGTTALMYYSQIYEAQALDDPAAREHYAELLRIHKSLGLLVLFLVGIRFVWNRYHTRPPLPAALTPVKRGIAVANHYLLYAMMVAIPLFGWFASMAYGGRTHFLGLFELPVIVDQDKDAAALYRNWHIWLGWLLFAAIALHLAAALWHHFRKRDATLIQMLPWSLSAPARTDASQTESSKGPDSPLSTS